MSTAEQMRECERRLNEIEVVMKEYGAEILAYAEFMDDFRKRTGRMHPLLPISRETEEGVAA